jgi:hypothetical protein
MNSHIDAIVKINAVRGKLYAVTIDNALHGISRSGHALPLCRTAAEQDNY